MEVAADRLWVNLYLLKNATEEQVAFHPPFLPLLTPSDAPEMKHKWKKEAVVAYKFDYIDKDIIISESLWWRFTYLGIYFALIRTILMYAADIFSIVVLFVPFLKAADGQSISVAGSDWLTFFGTAMDEGLRTAFKWLYVASVGVSLCLLIVDAYKAQKIIRSRDISLAMTSLTARRWYSMKQYAYYCLFQRLAAARKTKDGLAFFTFYSLKGNLGSLLHKRHCLMSKIRMEALPLCRIDSCGHQFEHHLHLHQISDRLFGLYYARRNCVDLYRCLSLH